MNTIYTDIQTRMSRFGSDTLKLADTLKDTQIPASVISQLIRSATAVGANFAEARSAESRADFIHKIKLALKECREAKHWLSVLQHAPDGPQRTIIGLLSECDAFCAILYSSTATARANG